MVVVAVAGITPSIIHNIVVVVDIVVGMVDNAERSEVTSFI